jgi:hypothetical protein
MHGLFLVQLEIGVLIANICSSILYMCIRALFSESFLQEEWTHGQLAYYNSLNEVDFLDWDIFQVQQFNMLASPFFITCFAIYDLRRPYYSAACDCDRYFKVD